MRVTSLIPGWNRDYSMRKNYAFMSVSIVKALDMKLCFACAASEHE